MSDNNKKSLLNLKPTAMKSKSNSKQYSVKTSNRASNNTSPKKSQGRKSSRSSKSSDSSHSSSSKSKRSSDESHDSPKKSRSESNDESPIKRGGLMEQSVLEDEDEEQLVKFNMNFSQLNDYLNNIIKVINQHAKILQNLNQEVQVRTTEKQIGEIFSVISAGLPYDTLVKKLGGMIPPRRGSVMKLLGDATLVQNTQSFQMAMSSQPHSRRQSYDEQSFGGHGKIATPKESQGKQQQQVMLEGAERLLKATEMVGKYLVDLKEYSHSNDCTIIRIDSELNQRITKPEFQAFTREKSKKLKNKLRTVISQFEEKITGIDKKMDGQMEDFKKKLQDIELNTYWKIKDYEDLLKQRVSETFMKDYIKGEVNKLERELRGHVEFEKEEVLKTVDNVDMDVRKIRDAFGDQIGELRKGTDQFTYMIEQERETYDQKIDDLKKHIESLLEQKNQKDEIAESKINFIEKKIGLIEKMAADSSKNASKSIDYVDSEQFQMIKEKNESLVKKIEKLEKKFKKISEKNTEHIDKLEKEIAKKAEKDSMIQNQQQFFSNLAQIESETDASITKLVGDELKKLGEQIQTNTKILDKKIQKVYQDIDIDKVQKSIEKKLSKDDLSQRIDGVDNKLAQNDKLMQKLSGQLQRLQSFTENLALAIKNLENTNSQLLQKPPNMFSGVKNSFDANSGGDGGGLPQLSNKSPSRISSQMQIGFGQQQQIEGIAYEDLQKQISNQYIQQNSRHNARPMSSHYSQPQQQIQQQSQMSQKSNAMKSSQQSLNNSMVQQKTSSQAIGFSNNRPTTQENLRMTNVGSNIAKSGGGNYNSQQQTIVKGPLNKLLNLSNGEISQAVGVTQQNKNNMNKNGYKTKSGASYIAGGDDGNHVERVFRKAET